MKKVKRTLPKNVQSRIPFKVRPGHTVRLEVTEEPLTVHTGLSLFYAMAEALEIPRGEGTGEGTLVPRQLTMKTLGILQGEGCGKLLQNQHPLIRDGARGPAMAPNIKHEGSPYQRRQEHADH